MKLLAADTETFLPQPGAQAAPLVCFQFTLDDSEPQLIHARDPACRRTVEQFLLTPDVLWSGHNFAYDTAAICAQWPELTPAVFEAYRQNRITCTETRHRLIHIAQGTFKRFDKIKGSFSLEGAAKFLECDVTLDKTSDWRVRYGKLYPVDVSAWPQDALAYALNDAVAQRAVHRAQDAYAAARNLPLADQFRKSYDSFWTYLVTCWGIRTDQEQVERYAAQVSAELEKAKATILAAGLLRPNGTKDTKKAKAHMEACCAALGIDPPRTKTGEVALDEDALELYGDPLLEAYQMYGSMDTRLKRVNDLRYPVIQPGYKALGADTGRMSCIGSNPKKAEWVSARKSQAQNPPRATGYRECFVPGPGRLMWSVDWAGIELRTWAQRCIDYVGFSRMADVLNAGGDPYIELAADMGGLSAEQAYAIYAGSEGKERKAWMKGLRNAAKPIVLGAPTGMGGAKIVLTARKTYGVPMTVDEAKGHIATWKRRFPEGQKWLDWANRMLSGRETCTYTYPGSERMRGGLWYTALANGAFQGAARDLFGDAGQRIAYECYVDKRSVLYGSRILVPLHDEFLGESPADIAHECAHRVSEIMCEVGPIWCPNLANAFSAPPALMTRWRKGAEPVYENGRLVPWTPEAG